jgi:hypothetical protein
MTRPLDARGGAVGAVVGASAPALDRHPCAGGPHCGRGQPCVPERQVAKGRLVRAGSAPRHRVLGASRRRTTASGRRRWGIRPKLTVGEHLRCRLYRRSRRIRSNLCSNPDPIKRGSSSTCRGAVSALDGSSPHLSRQGEHMCALSSHLDEIPLDSVRRPTRTTGTGATIGRQC